MPMTTKSRLAGFWRAGHPGTLFSAFLYFDLTFAVWVLNGALAPFISEEFHLSAAQKGLMLSVPVIAGALMRFPLGVLSQFIGRKRAALVEMSLICVGLLIGWQMTDSYGAVIAMGVPLGVAGAAFGVALSLGAGWYPPEYKGLAMGIAGAGNSGAVLAVLFAPPLASHYGWRAVYGLAILPILAAMIILQLLAKEPPDRDRKSLREYLKVIVDRDAWIFNVLYMVTFGGYIGLTSFLPTLFHDQYLIPKEQVGGYAAIAIISASVLRIGGGWLADKLGGIRMLMILMVVIMADVLAAASLPASPELMVAVLVIGFAAMGAGNGAVFQLVPLRFKGQAAVAGSLVGEIGALAGGFLPNALGVGKDWTGSYGPGLASIAVIALFALTLLMLARARWTSSWVGEGGRALGTATVPVPVPETTPAPAPDPVYALDGRSA
jgi:NNP family nitrate/nitrite transporter-like MFS transporter